MNFNFNETIIANILKNPEYFNIVAPHIKTEYFNELHYKTIIKTIYGFLEEYKSVPTVDSLRIMVEQTAASESEYNSILNVIDIVDKLQPDINLAWLIDSTERFCKGQAIYNALSRSLEIRNNFDLPENEQISGIPDVGMIPDIMKDALSVVFDNAIGHDLWVDSEDRHASYTAKANKISFGAGLESLDTLTNGGVENGTLSLILAPVNTGKSLGLCALSTQYLKSGLNVLYISLEMDEYSVAKRIDANLLNTNLDDLDKLDYKSYSDKLDEANKKCVGSLKVKQYPTSNAGVLEFTSLLNELQLKQNWKPDVIMIDYLGIAKSKRLTTSDNTYTYLKSVSEEIRGFAIEQNIPIWSAVQTNRAAWNSSDIAMDNIADSAAVAATADFIIGIIETEELIINGQQLIKPIKNRFGSKDVNVINIIVDKAKQRWVDATSYNKSNINSLIAPKISTQNTSMNDVDPDNDGDLSNICW